MARSPVVDIACNQIRYVEGFRPAAYLDQGGVWTVGYGFTEINGAPVTSGATISQDAADNLMVALVSNMVGRMAQVKNWPRLNCNQQAACVSLAWNIGLPAFLKSSVAAAITGWNLQRVPADFLMWDKYTVNKKLLVSRGLTARRRSEVSLWLRDPS